jgi:uncharacterized membrane protein
MSPTQKHAWYNLAVVVFSAGVVLALVPLMGVAAQGGFGFLGLLGFGPFFFCKKNGQVVTDERDTQIQRKSVIVGYTAFWLMFVGSACLAALWYGVDGAVPVMLIMAFCWSAVIVFYGVMSVATLIQYGWGTGA